MNFLSGNFNLIQTHFTKSGSDSNVVLVQIKSRKPDPVQGKFFFFDKYYRFSLLIVNKLYILTKLHILN